MFAMRFNTGIASSWSVRIALTLGLVTFLALPAAARAVGSVPSPSAAVSAAVLSAAATKPLFDVNDIRRPDGAWFSSFMAPARAIATSGDNRIDSLLMGEELSFGGSGATSRTVTYSFYEDSVFNGTYYGTETGVREVSEGTKANVRKIFAWYSTIMNVDFVEVTESLTTIGHYRIMLSNGPDYGYCYPPYSDEMFSESSDIHLKPSYDTLGSDINGFQNPPGSHGYSALAHEMGHGMGLKHPHQGSPLLPPTDDNTANTIMSYSFTGDEPATPMAYDVAALQYMYGVRAKNTGNDTYAFTSRGTSQYTLGGTTFLNTPNQLKQTIWDSAGFDTLDATLLSYVATGYKLDLRGNGWLIGASAETTDAAGKHYFENGTSLAFDFAPEKIINSSSDDRISANGSANTFAGYTVARSVGADRIEGASAADKIDLTAYLESSVTKSRVGNDLLLNLGAPGSVTLVDYYTGNVPVIEYSGKPPNVPPTPRVSASAMSGVAPMSVNFDGSSSTDSDGAIQSWVWSFSDGTSASGITASKLYSVAGTYTASLTVMDNDGASATTTTTIVVAPALGSLAGTVTSERLPLSGVTVSIAGRTASTNALGGYSLASIPASTYPVTFSKSGYTSQTTTVTISHNTTTTSSVSLIHEIGNLSGTVKYGAALLGGVTVSVAGTTTTTAADGTYAFTALPKGSYAATYSKSGYLSQTTSVTISTGVTTAKNIFMAREVGVCSGTVTSGGAGLSGVGVTLTSPSGTKTATTTGSGAYTITGLLTDTYSASFTKSGYDTQTVPALISANQATTVDVRLVRQTGTLSGTVTSGGLPLSGVTVTAAGLTTLTAANGTYSIGSIPTDSYSASYAKSGYISQTMSVTINTGLTTTKSIFMAREVGACSGTVTSGGIALSGATVSMSGRTATTATDGTYSIASIPVGVYSASYAKNGYLTQTVTVTILSEQTTSRSVSLVGSPVTERVVERVAGNDRFDTAVRLARRGWDPTRAKAWAGVKHVIVANGESGKEADPIGAAGLAGAYDCPVLLTAGSKLPSSTRAVIAEIALKNPGVAVHLIGGASVVPEARWSEIKAIPGVSKVQDRVSGADRYLTSAAIANAVISLKGPAAVNGFILIAADNPSAFFDALAASPFAYANTMPMLSVKKGSVPPSVGRVMNAAELKDKPRYAASSATYIGAGALSSATRMTTSSNRYSAARDIASFGMAPSRMWASPVAIGLAAGLPDALAGGAFLGKGRGVMLFTDSSKVVQPASKGFVTAEKNVIENGWVIGGTTVLPTSQETSFRNLLK